MRPKQSLYLTCLFVLAIAFLSAFNHSGLDQEGRIANAAEPSAKSGLESTTAAGWYFAVSGDSRDCGDLIMPKIARSIDDNRAQAPVQFYWHLGDLRRMYDIDCDFIKRKHPAYD